MGDVAAGKTKKSKKHGDDAVSSDRLGSTAHVAASTSSSASLAPPVTAESADGASKSKKTSRSSLSVPTHKSEEKSKDKPKDKAHRKLAKEGSHSAQTTPVPQTPVSPFLHEAEVYKRAGRIKGWKKRTLKLRANGDLEYYHGGRMRGSFSMLGSAVILDRKDPCRFEIDTGRGIWHLRTPTPEDREVWVVKIQAIGKSHRSEDSAKNHLESRIEALHKHIGVAKSLEAVLASRAEVLKGEPRANSNLDSSSEAFASSSTSAAILLEDSSEHHKQKKKKGHSRTKSEDVHGTPTILQQVQEIQRTIAQLIGSIEGIGSELSEAVNKLDQAMNTAAETQRSAEHRSTTSKLSSEDEFSGKDVTPPPEPMIIYNEEHSGSDSEDYFDADMESSEMPDDDSSSSSAEYFETGPASLDKKTIAKKSTVVSYSSSSTLGDSGSLSGASSDQMSVITSSAPATSSSPALSQATAQSGATNSPGRGPKKTKSKSKSRRLSRNFSHESRTASLKIQLKPSGVSVAETLAIIPSSWSPRAALPHDKPKGTSIPIMKILKDAVGKDISRITIPVSFSEPINMLQRLVEDFEYGEILLQASEEPDVRRRLLLVSAFASSSYASIYVRRTKPFNPILGETFEFVDQEKQYRLMTEQVSHHPPIAAFTVDAPGYTVWGHAHAKTKFWGKSLEINPTGSISMRLHKFDEVYTWNKITTCMNNIIVGTKWIDNYGELSVYNQTTGHKCLMDFKKQGWFGAHAFEIVGTAHDPDDTATFKIEGLWNEYFAVTPIGPDGEPNGAKSELWRKTPLPPHSDKQYNFTSYTMRLNELAEWMKPYLPPTDSRLRPDQRALEDVQTDFAQSEKSRLEDKQRAARKKLEESGAPYEPTWFSRGEGDSWVYKGGYWEARQAKNWPASLSELF